MKRIYLAAVLPILTMMLLGSCAQQETHGPDNGEALEISFDMGFAPVTKVSTDAAFKSAWEEGDAVGIFAVKRSAGGAETLLSAGNYIHNIKVTYGPGSGSSVPGVWTIEGGDVFFPSGDFVLDFYAYYPYDDNNGAPQDLDPTALAFAAHADQDEADADGNPQFESSYFLTASTLGAEKNSPHINLSFSHAMSMVQLTVEGASSYLMEPGTVSAQVMGCAAEGVMNLGTGVVTPGDMVAGGIKMFRMEEPDGLSTDRYVFRAMIPAQTGHATTQPVRFSTGYDHFWWGTAGFTFEAGTVENIGFKPEHGDYAQLIPDREFRRYLLTNFDGNGDGELSHDEALQVRNISVNNNGYDDLADMTGIKYFRNLETLTCVGTKLTTLDVSGCENLSYLSCEQNQLTTLDVSGCTNLFQLYCHQNQLSNLDVSGCGNLYGLHCEQNRLTTLDVSGCENLSNLNCHQNQLTTLDVSGCENLSNLNCHQNQLTTLDVSGCENLSDLHCYQNQLTNLDVSGCENLSNLNCNNNQLTNLDVSGYDNLSNLNCNNNQLTNLDVSGCENLSQLICHQNELTEIDVSKCEWLAVLYCYDNEGLTTIWVWNTADLTGLAGNSFFKKPAGAVYLHIEDKQ